MRLCRLRLGLGLCALALALAACIGPPATTAPAPTLPPPAATLAQTAAPPAATATPSPPAATLPPTASATPDYDPFGEQFSPGESQFAIPPAFQRVQEDLAVLYFALEPPAAGTVFYRGEGGLLESAPFSAEAAQHTITLTGLAPATRYDVLVVTGQAPDYALPRFLDAPWGAQSIRTPPYPAPLRFAALADTGFGDPITARLAERIAEAQAHFVLLPGDIVYRMDEQRSPAEAYRLKYFAPFAPVLRQAAIFPAVGNHELDAPGRVNGIPYYYTAFPPVFDTSHPAWNGAPLRKWYAFAYNGIQFLSLNTQTLFGDEGRAEQDAWLEERLADTSFAYTVPFFHVPPFSSALHFADGRNVRGWADRFEAAGVPLAVSGHDHVYERLRRGPTTYIVTGGGSGTLYQMRVPSEFSEFFASASHYTLFEVYSDRIEVRAIGVDGAVIDQVVIPAEG